MTLRLYTRVKRWVSLTILRQLPFYHTCTFPFFWMRLVWNVKKKGRSMKKLTPLSTLVNTTMAWWFTNIAKVHKMGTRFVIALSLRHYPWINCLIFSTFLTFSVWKKHTFLFSSYLFRNKGNHRHHVLLFENRSIKSDSHKCICHMLLQ